MIRVTRKTTESKMEVRVSPPPVDAQYRSKIQTPLPFLNHMIEHLVWRSGYNIETAIELPDFNLTHVVCEDLGITVGKAFAAQLQKNIPRAYMALETGLVSLTKRGPLRPSVLKAVPIILWKRRESPRFARKWTARTCPPFWKALHRALAARCKCSCKQASTATIFGKPFTGRWALRWDGRWSSTRSVPE